MSDVQNGDNVASARHVDGGQLPPAAQAGGQNQISVVIDTPTEIRVTLVDAQALDALEEWTVAFSVCLAALTGFAVPTVEAFVDAAPSRWWLACISIVVSIATLHAGRKAYQKRAKVNETRKTMRVPDGDR